MCTLSDCVLLQVSVMYACVCVALIFAYTTRCATTRQVRRPLVRSESLPCPTELEALFLVCTSTPLVPLDSAPGRRGNSSDCLVGAHACFLVVQYIWRINGAPQGTSGRCRKTTFRVWTQDDGYQESWSASHDSLHNPFSGRGNAMMLLVLCVICYGDLVLLMFWARLGWSELFQTAWEARHFYAGHCVRKKAGSCCPSLRVTRDRKRDLDPIALYYHFNVFNVDSIRFSTVLCSLTRDRNALSRPFWSRRLPTQKFQGEAGAGLMEMPYTSLLDIQKPGAQKSKDDKLSPNRQYVRRNPVATDPTGVHGVFRRRAR